VFLCCVLIVSHVWQLTIAVTSSAVSVKVHIAYFVIEVQHCRLFVFKNKKFWSDLGRGRDAANSPLVTVGHSTFARNSYPFPLTIAKSNYLPHPWTHSTHHTKSHPYPISRFATMHWTDRKTDRQTHSQNNWWLEGIVDDYRLLLLYRERRGVIIQKSIQHAVHKRDK